MSNKLITATYKKDSEHYHRFIIDKSRGIVGNIYIQKGSDIPKCVIIELKWSEAAIRKGAEARKKKALSQARTKKVTAEQMLGHLKLYDFE